MASQPDLAKLTQTELLRLVNGTPLGAVLTRGRLRGQMDAAGTRIGDGKTIHLLRYLRWLVEEVERSQTGRMNYAEAKRRQAERNRAATKAGQDVGPIPEIADLQRRRRACRSLKVFGETYFPAIFHRPWSKDHIKAIRKLEKLIRRGGLFALAMPRGSGKTCLLIVAALWAVLTRWREFVCIVAAAEKAGRQLLAAVKQHIMSAELLAADFPEVIHPLRALENSSKRQLSQHVAGQLTYVRWDKDMLVFPTLRAEVMPKGAEPINPLVRAEPAVARKSEVVAGGSTELVAGGVISVTSLDANIRGQQHARADGTTIRPSLALVDDPQTRQSARSPGQTRLRMQLLHGDVLAMGDPGRTMACGVMCTKIYVDDLADQILDREKQPQWQGECTKLIYHLPGDAKRWEEYARLWADSLRRGHGGREATEFYREHRKAMDKGAVVAWEEAYDPENELSAVQHAMNLKLQDAEAFEAEYQNAPQGEQVSDDVLRPQQVAEKLNGRKRGTVPLAAPILTMFADVHDRLLYWAICAWQEDFTGYNIDYSTFPPQGLRWFAMRTARKTLRRTFPGKGEDGAIYAGLARLVSEYTAKEWPRTGGGVLRIGRIMVDMGYKPEIVAAVKHAVGGDTMMLSRGVGITAARRPMSQYRRKPGERHGHNWYMPNVRGTNEFPHVSFDANYWKSFVHRALATPLGEAGALSLFGRNAAAHELMAEHVAGSETWVVTHGQGRTVQEWRQRPNRPDNHWLDCLVGCAVAASMLGAKAPGMEIAAPRRKRYTQADLSHATRGGAA